LSKPEVFQSRLAAFPKKILQDCSAFFLQNTRCDFAPVIQGLRLHEIHDASGSAGNRVCTTKNHAPDPCVHECAGAPRSRLCPDVKLAIYAAPITNCRFTPG